MVLPRDIAFGAATSLETARRWDGRSVSEKWSNVTDKQPQIGGYGGFRRGKTVIVNLNPTRRIDLRSSNLGLTCTVVPSGEGANGPWEVGMRCN